MEDKKIFLKIFLATIFVIGLSTLGLSKILPSTFFQDAENVVEEAEYLKTTFEKVYKVNKKHSNSFNGFKKEKIDGEEYYIITDEYAGEYFLINSHKSPTTKAKVMSFEEYSKFCKEWNLFQKYFDITKDYIVYSYNTNSCAVVHAKFAGMKLNKGKADLYIWDNVGGCVAEGGGYYLVIPVEKGIKEVNIIPTYKENEIKNLKKFNSPFDPNITMIGKPVIYLYPEETTKVNVKLNLDGKFLFTYPEYNNEWNVIANPDGSLLNLYDNKEYSYLFWEGESDAEWDLSKGYVVKGEDTVEFLQDVLSKIGLTPKEYNEFIVYWAPLMEGNEYNLISFQEEIYEETAELIINPKPDSVLRVFMTYKALDKPIDIEAPTIKPFKRNGFTVVEWGGTEVK